MIFEPKLTLLAFLLLLALGPPAVARTCKTQSEAADYKCPIKDSKNEIDIKYRYRKSKRRSVKLEYLREAKGPYSKESFIVKADPEKQSADEKAEPKMKKQNCLLFGLLGKCVRKRLKICNSVLNASHTVTHGILNSYKYRRVLSFDIARKSGSYSYLRKTPKASTEHRLDSFQIEFENCRLIKKY